MIPGIGLFYSGMTKRKSGLSLLWLSFMAMAVTSVQVCLFFILINNNHYWLVFLSSGF
jgi:ammonia channel protein AmtB